MKASALDLSLYLVLDPQMVRGLDLETFLHQAIKGGVSIVQVREKYCSNEDFLQLAHRVSQVTKNLQVPLLINDRVDIALKVGAEGVHIGQADLPWWEARRLLPKDAIVGVSVESVAQAKELEGKPVQYLGVSSIFPTRTKKDIQHLWGIEGLKDLRTKSTHALVGIGGIDKQNLREVLSAGADGVAVVSALCGVRDPFLEAQHLSSLIQSAREGSK